MQKYKIIASKSQKKYTLVLSADSESHAKDKLHKEGYSILSIENFSWDTIEWNKFIFQIQKEGEIKKWIIVGTDIFKAYVKLRQKMTLRKSKKLYKNYKMGIHFKKNR